LARSVKACDARSYGLLILEYHYRLKAGEDEVGRLNRPEQFSPLAELHEYQPGTAPPEQGSSLP
jgi:hypothetical protein